MSSRTLACGDCMEVLAVYEEGKEPGPIIHECSEQQDKWLKDQEDEP